MFGLTLTAGATASLMLNLESVLTAVLAWMVFKENADRRIVAGMLAIVAGGLLLAWPQGAAQTQGWIGPLAVALACACWAVDNNLTRKVSASDALFIAGIKGLVAGLVNCSLALLLGAKLPQLNVLGPTLIVGFLGYGISWCCSCWHCVGSALPGPARTFPRRRSSARQLPSCCSVKR